MDIKEIRGSLSDPMGMYRLAFENREQMAGLGENVLKDGHRPIVQCSPEGSYNMEGEGKHLVLRTRSYVSPKNLLYL